MQLIKNPYSKIDVRDQSTWPEIKTLIRYYNDLIFDYEDDPRVPFWINEVNNLSSILESGETIYIPF